MENPALDPTNRNAPLAGDLDRTPPPSFLDRTLDLGAVSWAALGWTVVLVVGVALRLTNLDVWALAPNEAERAYDAYALYIGRPSAPGDPLPTTAPLFLLLQSFAFFLFGVTDATARLMPTLLGLALIGLTAALGPFVGRAAALGMAALVAVSPTLVYASRSGDPEIAVATFALLTVVAFLRTGLPDASSSSIRRWAAITGVAVGALLASGPSAVSVLLALLVGGGAALTTSRGQERMGAVARSLAAMNGTPGAWISAGVGLLATLLTLFTRLFSDFGAISGLGTTFSDWGRLIATGSSPLATQFFLLAILLYEVLAVAFALVAVNGNAAPSRPGHPSRLGWPFFAGWFATTLLLFSFSAGRQPLHLVHVALPLLLLGGAAVGELLDGLDWRDTLRGEGGLLALALLGALIGLSAAGILGGRIDEAASRGQAIAQVLFVAVLVIVPLTIAVIGLVRGERAAGRPQQPAKLALLVLGLLLAAYTLRSSVMLNFYNANEGTELLAQRTPTGSIRPMVEGMMRLSRDATLTRGSVRDVTGGRGLSIALDQRVEWPFRWYFRDFPDLSVVAPGQTAATTAEVVFAPSAEGLPESGYTPQDYPYLNRIPAAYGAPDIGGILANVILPSRWLDGIRYLLYRELETPAAAETMTVGLNPELSARRFPNSGPYNLLDRAGAGAGRGQFSNPRGITVSDDGAVTYVVDMGNLRVERFDANGAFIGAWGGEEDATISFGLDPNGQFGPTGIAVGPDGLVYVADTWNHRVVGLDESGAVVREIGQPGTLTNTGDDPALVTTSPGLFFGPRAVTVSADEIYVVDTGNERIQVFGLDGTFRRSWGGKGTAPDQLSEPVGIALGPDGRVYVADSGNGRISVFEPDGRPVAQWPVTAWSGQAGAYFEPYLTFGEDGLLYATSKGTGSVEVIGPDGSLVDSIRTIGSESLQAPVGIGPGREGAILITDTERHAVFRYVPPSVTEDAAGTGEQPAEQEQPEDSDGGDAPGPAASPTSQLSPAPPGAG